MDPLQDGSRVCGKTVGGIEPIKGHAVRAAVDEQHQFAIGVHIARDVLGIDVFAKRQRIRIAGELLRPVVEVILAVTAVEDIRVGSIITIKIIVAFFAGDDIIAFVALDVIAVRPST